jgi:phosphomevalonate decarboxylase
MSKGKATAVAYPIQGIIKYHGLVDAVRRIPYHNSISVCTKPTRTRTTVEVLPSGKADRVRIDGEEATGRALERVERVLDVVRALAEEDVRFRIESESNFPKFVGLGSSASGFAALATAACQSLGLPLSPSEVSEIARVGAGSATRSVTGGFSEWITRGQRSYGRSLAAAGELDWAIVGVVVQNAVPTEGVHTQVKSSPFFRARLEYLEPMLEAARDAIRKKDSVALMALAERDTLNLHAVTMTMDSGLVAWSGVTVDTIHRVRGLREGGIPAYFSIDTGSTVYVNTLAKHRDEVREALAEVVPDPEMLLDMDVGPAAHASNEHLF